MFKHNVWLLCRYNDIVSFPSYINSQGSLLLSTYSLFQLTQLLPAYSERSLCQV